MPGRAGWIPGLVVVLAWLAWPAVPGHAGTPDHDIKLPAEDRATAGETRELSLTIAPRPGYTISRDGPLRVDLRAPASGIRLPRRRYQRRDAADARAEAPRFDLRYQALAPGRHAVTVDLRFWVCARQTCRPVHAVHEVMVEVEPDPAPGPASGPARSPTP